MNTSAFAALAGMGMLAMLVFIVTGILIAALVLGLAFRLVVGYMPSYLRSIGAVLLTGIASLVVAVLLRMILPGGLSGLLVLAAQFLVGAAVVNWLLPAQNGSQIGYGKACLVQLLYLVLAIVLGLILGVIVGVLFGGMLAGMR